MKRYTLDNKNLTLEIYGVFEMDWEEWASQTLEGETLSILEVKSDKLVVEKSFYQKTTSYPQEPKAPICRKRFSMPFALYLSFAGGGTVIGLFVLSILILIGIIYSVVEGTSEEIEDMKRTRYKELLEEATSSNFKD